MIALVAQVLQHRQAPGPHLFGNLFEHAAPGHLPRQFVDHHGAFLALPRGPNPQHALPLFVDLPDLRRRSDQFAPGREIGPRYQAAECVVVHPGPGGEPLKRNGQFLEVVRRNVGGHAHRNTGRPVDQHIGQLRGQELGFLERAVEVVGPIHRALPQFRQQGLRIRGKARFRVTHGGEGLRIVHCAKVAVTVHQRVAIGERLRQVHHGLVAGRITVRVELADHVADRARALARLRGSRQPQFTHRIDDTALHRLETVGQMRQRPVQDDVHGVIQVRLLRVFRQRPRFRVVARHQRQLRPGHQLGERAPRPRRRHAASEGEDALTPVHRRDRPCLPARPGGRRRASSPTACRALQTHRLLHSCRAG